MTANTIARFLLFTLALTLPALAEDPAPFTLRACVETALQRQAGILQGANAVESARARATQAKSAYYPSIAISHSTVLAESGRATGQRDGASLTITENFYDGGLREARISGANAAVAQSGYTLARTRQTVVYAVTRDYFALLRARQLATVQTARVAYLENYLTLVQARVDAGDAAEVDRLPVEAQLANARVDLLAAHTAIRTASVQLQQAMGLSPSPAFTVADYAAPPALPITSFEDSLARGAADRPEVGETRAGVQSAGASVKSAKIALLPRLVVNGSFDQPIASGDPNAFTIVGGIAYDLFNGGSNRAAYREAQVSLSSAEIRAAQISRDIEAEVEAAYLNLESARERLAASDLSLQAAQKNVDVQQDRYAQGLAITLDLLNAQVEVVTARSSAIQARYDYYTSYAQLEYAIGTQGGLYAH
ncbi:MAG TPA: TolC family protein [Armatimonadota bacterium]|nr:TolC family protein [Armatimonadota bacterium]HOS42135.1 TolC family protein [Armatimonadota bacterium]